MAPVNEAAREKAMARMALMQDICGKKCFLPYDDIDAIELANAANGIRKPSLLDRRTYSTNNDSRWMPSIAAKLEEFVEVCIQTKTTVKARAKVYKLRDQSKINRVITDALIQLFSAWNQSIPLSLNAKNEIIAATIGNANRLTISNAFWSSFSDLPHMTNWALDTSTGRQVVALLRTRSIKSLEDLAQLRDTYARTVSSSENLREGRKIASSHLKRGSKGAITMFREQHIAGLFLEHEAYFKSRSVSRELLEEVDFAEVELPRIDTLIALKSENLALNTITDRSLDDAETDFGDLQHTNYLPYVDLFRADAFASSLIKKQSRMMGTQIVSRLVHLPDSIARLHQQLCVASND